MQKATHIITFLRRAQKFSQQEGITSILIVDKENTVEDCFEINIVGGMIAEIDNHIGEIFDVLLEHYTKTHDVNNLIRLMKLKDINP